MPPETSPHARATGLPAVLAVTFLGSLGTGVFWNGFAFIAKHTYGFDQAHNLLLYAVMGAVYTAGAFRAGSVVRFAGRWMSPRTLLMTIVGLQALVCLLPLYFGAEWALWTAAVVMQLLTSFLWPIVESYVTAGRHGPAMRGAIAWFNVVWMPASALPLFIMAPILERHGVWTFAGLAATAALMLIPLTRFSAWPAAHDAGVSREHVPPRYRLLLRSARVLLPASYIIISVLTPILPYRFEAIGLEVWGETPSTATWMIARVVAMLVMWRLPFWHGRWGTLLLGAVLLAGGFAAVVLAGTLIVMLAGLAGLGAGMGIVYYTALYYGMAVGHAEVDAGGRHEGLIGVGYTVGPLAGLAGTALGGGAWIVGVAWAIIAGCAVPAVRPYLEERRGRRNR